MQPARTRTKREMSSGACRQGIKADLEMPSSRHGRSIHSENWMRVRNCRALRFSLQRRRERQRPIAEAPHVRFTRTTQIFLFPLFYFFCGEDLKWANQWEFWANIWQTFVFFNLYSFFNLIS